MYGKFFASAFTGSMYGAGPDVFAVWAYVIANTRDSQVELNPVLLASTLGTTQERVQAAIDFLCAPDSRSRSKDAEGRRLLREGEYAYSVPTFAAYRAIRNEDDRREYNRIKKAEQREREKAEASNVKDSVIDSQRKSAHTEAVTEAESKADAFTTAWDAYPKRAGSNSRAAAYKAFCARIASGVSPDDLVAGVVRYAAYVRATGREGSEFVKQGSSFFGPNEHWLEPWNIPAPNGNGAPTRQDRNLAVLNDWLAKEQASGNP